MSNKFLGLDSVNVLKEYIDNQITSLSDNTRVITIQAYSYHKDGDKPMTPTGGGFDTESSSVVYPEGWSSLSKALNDIEDIESALLEGSIWMTAGVMQGTTGIVWSTPMKISGQNGVSVKFAYSYDKNATEDKRTVHPNGVTVDNRVEYVWTQSGEEEWQGPFVWAMYAEDATMVYWRYCVTGENEDGTPIQPPTPSAGPWVNNIPLQSLSNEYPYMWMSWQIVQAGQQSTDSGWSEPVLFGHYGKNGEDGDVPNYTQNLYCKGTNSADYPDLLGVVAPAQPELTEGSAIDDYITEDWLELPVEDDYIWWMCTFKVNGRTNEVMEIGPVKRYNAIDGTAKPGPFTKYLYRWSDSQLAPEYDSTDIVDGWMPSGWIQNPDENTSTNPEASLWMIAGNATGLNENGYPAITEWSEPVKVSGPRGPIAYDYRVETRYWRGTSAEPQYSSDDYEWSKTIPSLTSDYPYVWAQNYLVYYKMKYSDTANKDGSYDIVVDESVQPQIIESYGEFRLSGTNGEDGSKKNNVHYSTSSEAVTVTSFTATNYYISNSTEDVTYTMGLDTLSFINGYTGKFANIGTGNMVLNAGSFVFAGSGTTATDIVLAPNETIELVCYKHNDTKQLLVIGKTLIQENS